MHELLSLLPFYPCHVSITRLDKIMFPKRLGGSCKVKGILLQTCICVAVSNAGLSIGTGGTGPNHILYCILVIY